MSSLATINVLMDTGHLHIVCILPRCGWLGGRTGVQISGFIARHILSLVCEWLRRHQLSMVVCAFLTYLTDLNHLTYPSSPRASQTDPEKMTVFWGKMFSMFGEFLLHCPPNPEKVTALHAQRWSR